MELIMETIHITKEGTRYTYPTEDKFIEAVNMPIDRIENYCLKITEDRTVKVYDERLIIVSTWNT